MGACVKLGSRSSRIALDAWLEQRKNITLLVVLWFMRACIRRGTASLITSRTVSMQHLSIALLACRTD